MLEIKNLKSGYKQLKVLRGIDFYIALGEIVSIVGPNGAGKSTLLKSIFNSCDVYSGSIKFLGEDITKSPAHKLASKGISYVSQGRSTFPSLTVRENLEMGVVGIKDKDLIEKRIKNVFDLFPFLRDKKNDRAFTLSGGQRQILAISIALMQDPKIILLDEPSLGLSPKAMKEIFDIILKIKERGISVAIVEQNVKQVAFIADRAYVLKSGQIALEGGREILSSEKLKEVYLVK